MNASRFAYVTLIGLTGSSSLAIASEDTKVYPAAMCKPTDSRAGYRIIGDGSITVDSPTNIVCPVVTDSIGTLNDIERANIVVESDDDDTYPDCILGITGRDPRGIVVDPSSFVDVDENIRILRFGDGGADIPTPFAGTAYFFCYMFEDDSVISYSITENVGTN